MSVRRRVTRHAALAAFLALIASAAATYVVVHKDVHGSALTHLRLALAGGVVGGTVLAAVLVRLRARRALRPVAALAADVDRARVSGHAGRRVHAETRDPELVNLAAQFDALFAALERSQDSERRLVEDAAHELPRHVAQLRTHAEHGARAEVLADVEQLDALVAELLELARDGGMPLDEEDVRLEEVVREAVDAAPDRVRYETELEPVTVRGSSYRLGRAVAALLDNAAANSPPEGVVEVRVTREGELAVRDYGTGIPPDELPHVFERFYRGASARGRPGAGLGLAIVSQVAQQHGGTVGAEHPPGGGALFRLRLPAGRVRA